MPDSNDTGDLRKDYQLSHLMEADVAADPIAQFSTWFEAARAMPGVEPNVMTLATADGDGKPDARIVLLKGFGPAGFVFYTNLRSRKARELDANPRACLVFFWEAMERQVRVEGEVRRVSREETERYFHSRPSASQIGAWVSEQSAVIASRAELDEREKALGEKFAGGKIPLPDFWGGYRVEPAVMEFWQGRPGRLHDRLRYSLIQSQWKIERLSP